jgi:hypothetical protein
MIVFDIDKNVERDYWGDNNFNNRLVLPLLNQSANSSHQCLNVVMNERKKNRKKLKHKKNNKLKYIKKINLKI